MPKGKNHHRHGVNTHANLTPEQKEKHKQKLNGNKYWLLRNVKPGGQTKYNAETLWEKFLEYFEHMKDHYNEKPLFVGKDGIEKMQRIKAPLTIEGFSVFANMAFSTFRDYEEKRQLKNLSKDYKDYEENAKIYNDLAYVCSIIRKIVNTDQYEKAATGSYNANLIARYLNLVDKRDLTTNGNELPSVTKVQVHLPEGISLEQIEKDSNNNSIQEAEIVEDDPKIRKIS